MTNGAQRNHRWAPFGHSCRNSARTEQTSANVPRYGERIVQYAPTVTLFGTPVGAEPTMKPFGEMSYAPPASVALPSPPSSV